MSSRAVIHDWSLLQLPSRSSGVKDVLVGIVYGHPGRHQDGKKVITSAIVHARGRYVETKSGTTYRLGRISKKYRSRLSEIDHKYDRHNPLEGLLNDNTN